MTQWDILMMKSTLSDASVGGCAEKEETILCSQWRALYGGDLGYSASIDPEPKLSKRRVCARPGPNRRTSFRDHRLLVLGDFIGPTRVPDRQQEDSNMVLDRAARRSRGPIIEPISTLKRTG